jgi:hypothetical protein
MFRFTIINAAERINWDKQIEWILLSNLKAQLKFYLYDLTVSRRFNKLIPNLIIHDKKARNSDINFYPVFEL